MEVVRGMVWIFPGIAHYNIHAHIFFYLYQGCASNSFFPKASLEKVATGSLEASRGMHTKCIQ